ncbi:hypothetical protein H2203_006731 [Taxawa tesnikishii (nom. ined.)]|nr:hypothetical protein H2203_006731 [Dothideales sp. JES 119]
MVYRASLLLLASAAGVGLVAAQDSVRFGPYFSLGATTSYIVEAETTIYPGKTPSPQQARLALWPGMGTDAGDLIQTIVLSSTDAEAVNCGGKPRVAGEWCVFASALQDGTQVDGVTYPVTATQGATINYKYDATTGNTTQTVSVGGKAVSELSTKSGRAIGWGTAVECQDQCSGIVNAHTYENTTIVLAAVDTKFASTLAKNEATGTLVTTDNKTFKVSKISIQQSDFAAV